MDKAEYFFQKIKKTSLKATSYNAIEFFYNLADLKIKLVFAGNALIPLLTPALEHLQCESTQNIDLTIYLWDTLSTNIEPPSNDWGINDYLEHGLIQGYNTKNVFTTFNLGSGTLNIYNTNEKTALFWVRDARALPYYETGAPLRDIFSWLAKQYGMQYAHAAAVGTEEGAVLLVGKGGSGKSTSALSSLQHSDLYYIGDDYVLIQNKPEPYVYSLYNSAKLNADHAGNFPHLLKYAINPDKLDTEKALIFIQNIFPEKIHHKLPIKAIVLPHVTGLQDSSYTSTSAAHALRALAPSSMFQLPGSSQHTLQYFSQLVRKVPAYTLHAGTKFDQIPKTIISILKASHHDQ